MNNDDLKKILGEHKLWLTDSDQGCRADLTGANLRRANLSEANLSGANLTGANLRRANLRWSNLRWSNLTRAGLSGANLTGANLSMADLTRANLSGANLRRAVPVVPHIDATILREIEAHRIALRMSSYHTCETTHCRAGMAIHLAGPDGYGLEAVMGSSAAGALIYAMSRPNKPVPDFYADNGTAMADIVRCAAADPI
jgi:hypothetical protein